MLSMEYAIHSFALLQNYMLLNMYFQPVHLSRFKCQFAISRLRNWKSLIYFAYLHLTNAD
jgi:hypothetical protein